MPGSKSEPGQDGQGPALVEMAVGMLADSSWARVSLTGPSGERRGRGEGRSEKGGQAGPWREGGRAFVVDKSDQVGSSVPDIWTVGKGKGTRMVLLLRGH